MAKASCVAGFLLAALFLIGGIQFCACRNSSSGACIQQDRNALLKFKGSLQDPSNLLSSWEGKDCCQWNGVSCDENTGHVIKLDLGSDNVCGSYYSSDPQFGARKANISLVELKHLEYLDLSGINFQHSEIPKFFGSMKKLQYLDLSCTNLGGEIPTSLGQLVNLETFDISSNSLEGTLSEIHFSNLSRLKSLDIGYNYNLTFKVSSNWIPPFSLRGIGMENCKIEGSEFPQWLRTQEEVNVLFLRNASISGMFPMWLLSRPFVELDLSLNQISGPLPSNFGDDIFSLLLSDNRINGSIPNSLCRIQNLKDLDLSRNMLHGKVPHCWTDSVTIEYIDLSSNKLSGTIPASIVLVGSFLRA